MSDSGRKFHQTPPEGSEPVPPGLNASENDSHAIETLYREFAEDLQRIAWVILRDWPLAADAVQETFALLTSKIGEIPEPQRRGWLVKTVQFVSQNLRRKQQSHRRRIFGDSKRIDRKDNTVAASTLDNSQRIGSVVGQLAVLRDAAFGFKALEKVASEQGGEAERKLEMQESLEQIQLEMSKLPEEQSQVLKLRFSEEKSFAEIAKQLELPLGTVLSRTRLALAKLRKAFGSGRP